MSDTLIERDIPRLEGDAEPAPVLEGDAPEGEFQTVEMQLNMGPQHPSTHGVFRMILTIDGEKVVGCEPVIGYLHRGTEKLCEIYQYRQCIPLMDRLDYLANFNNELAFVMAVEKLMGLEVPERADLIRLILCEFNRITSHLVFYGAFGIDTGAMTPFLYGFREREKIQALFEEVTGARMMHNYFRPGGIFQDVPANFVERARGLLAELKPALAECDTLLTRNEIFVARTRNVGVISAADAINWGLSGPVLRATGVAEDIRRSEPYSQYPRFQFDVPTGTHGDAYDRYLVRFQEMYESTKIIEQALAVLPPLGPIQAPLPKTLKAPVGECYVRCENPRGEFGVYLISKGAAEPYRVRLRGASFCNLMALPQMVVGGYLADAPITLGSIDITLGEVDR